MTNRKPQVGDRGHVQTVGGNMLPAEIVGITQYGLRVRLGSQCIIYLTDNDLHRWKPGEGTR
jgi:hypothetical protein